MAQTSSAAPAAARTWLPEAIVGWRAQFTRILLAAALVWPLLALTPLIFSRSGFLPAAVFVAAYLALGVLAVLRGPGWLQLGAALLIIYALGISELLTSGGLGAAALFLLGLVVLATMLWSTRVGAIAAGLSVLSILVIGTVLSAGGFPGASSLGDWLAAALATALLSAAVVVGFRQLRQESGGAEAEVAGALQQIEAERSSLEERVASRTAQLRAVIEVGRAASAILDPEQLIAQVVQLISERFGYYYAAIFLLNEQGDQAELRNATGEAGRILKENRHRLPVGGNSMVGQAISTRQPRIALDTGAEPVRFDNPLLPYTRSEIALPLAVGDRVLGALDVQSTKAGAFGPSDIETLQGMANQVAIAFENARLFDQSSRSLQELEAIQRQYVATSWKPLMGDPNLEYNVGDEELTPESPRMEIPLALRDEIIGAINLSSESDWTPEQRNLVEAVATQAALALENARLVEASQSSARREHMLADITAKVWASTSVETVLRTAVSELAKALDADRATIELKVGEPNA